jgi:hydrogenase/urease accessory protein HupE
MVKGFILGFIAATVAVAAGGYFFATTFAACRTGCQAERVRGMGRGDLASRRFAERLRG